MISHESTGQLAKRRELEPDLVGTRLVDRGGQVRAGKAYSGDEPRFAIGCADGVQRNGPIVIPRIGIKNDDFRRRVAARIVDLTSKSPYS